MLRAKLMAGCLAILAMSATPVAAEPIKLKLAWVFTTNEISYRAGAAAFMKAVNEDPDAKDVLEIVAFPNGALGRVPADQPQLAEDGVTDFVQLGPSFSPGRFPELEVLELPGLFRDSREASAVHRALIASGRVKSLDKFVTIMSVASNPHYFHTRFPVNSLADLKGKKIRSHGATMTGTVRALGAVPVGLAISELAEAIGRGTIDGVVTQTTVIHDTKLDRVANNHFEINMGVFLINILMSKTKFDSLPPAAQAIIRKHSGQAFHDNYVATVRAYYAELDAKLKADPKQKWVQAGPADLKIADEAYRTVHATWAQQKPENAELLKFVTGELEKLRAGN